MARHGVRDLGKLAWAARSFWQSPLNRWVVDTVDPQPGEQVLDIGAGIGPATVLAARRVTDGRVIALEPTRVMRAGLRLRRLSQRSRSRIDVRTGKAEALPLADGTIDAAWSVNSAHHWDDYAAAAAELARVLRPGGRVLLVDDAFDDPDHPLHGLMEKHDEQHGIVDVDALAATFIEQGFAFAEGGLHTVAGEPVRVLRATMRAG